MNCFSLGWRLLLMLALALNPVLGAGAAFAAQGQADVPLAASVEVPPCHESAPASEEAPVDASHGCDCGNPGCEFAGCCTVAALALSEPLTLAGISPSALAVPWSRSGARPPPSARMIRPPIS